MLAATFGLGTGATAITLATSGILAPQMIADLGWTRAQFALLGMLSIVPSLCFPFAGRMADLFGVRATALVGIIALPLGYLAFSLMSGPVWQYIAIQVVLSILAITTTATIYTRIAVQYIDRARGLALAVIASGPAATGVAMTFAAHALVESHGWRLSYQALAVYAAVAGAITMLLLPRDKIAPRPERQARRDKRGDYPAIFRTPEFWILAAAMLTCNLPQILVMSQMKLVLLELEVRSDTIAPLLATLPLGMLAGRFAAGFALDHFPTHLVGFVGLGLPSIGLALLASGVTAPVPLALAVISLGFAIGAESDILAYVVAQRFGVVVFSSVMGLLTMVISLSLSAGSGLLGLTLKLTERYETFLWISFAGVLAGAFLILSLGLRPALRSPGRPIADEGDPPHLARTGEVGDAAV